LLFFFYYFSCRYTIIHLTATKAHLSISLDFTKNLQQIPTQHTRLSRNGKWWHFTV